MSVGPRHTFCSDAEAVAKSQVCMLHLMVPCAGFEVSIPVMLICAFYFLRGTPQRTGGLSTWAA